MPPMRIMIMIWGICMDMSMESIAMNTKKHMPAGQTIIMRQQGMSMSMKTMILMHMQQNHIPITDIITMSTADSTRS